MSNRATRLILLAAWAALPLAVHAAPAPDAAPQPEMVGEGIISTPDDEFGGTPSPDGLTLYFDKTVAPHYLYILCESRFSDGKWSEPTILPFSGRYRDSDPVLSPDGKTMFFASDRPVHGEDSLTFNIWRVEKRGAGWSDPEAIAGAINSEGSQVFASVANDGTMYFTSSRKTGNYDVFRSRLMNGVYATAEDLGRTINGPAIATFEAFIAPDQSYLLLGGFGREGGQGNADLFISFAKGYGWSKPVNLGPTINTAAREYSPRVSADGDWLYFASERGLQTDQRDVAWKYDEFVSRNRGVLNGLGNIYRVPMAPVLQNAKQATEEK